MTTARRALRWGAVSFAAAVVGVSTAGCELVAGTRDRTLAMADGESSSSASAGAGGTDAGTGGANAGAGGMGTGSEGAGGAGGGAGGGGPTTHPWPDSASSFCVAAGAQQSCSDVSSTSFQGQDGALEINRPDYMDVGSGANRTLTDTVTGLVWQGDLSLVNGHDLSWSDAKNTCETRKAAEKIAWRLPTRRELASLLDTGHVTKQPGVTFILPSVFDALITDAQVQNAVYWVDTGVQGTSDQAWAFNPLPSNSVVFSKPKIGDHGRALCVSGPTVYQKPALVAEEAIVRDKNTGLVFEKIAPTSLKNWSSALSYCNDLSLGGIADFRLPTLKELLYLVDDSRVNPAIDKTLFPMTASASYWSSSPHVGNTSTIYVVDFSSGEARTDDYQNMHYVRCVH